MSDYNPEDFFEAVEPKQKIENYIENPLEFHLEINDVQASKIEVPTADGKGVVRPFKDLIRDYSNANLNSIELYQVRLYNDLYELCLDIGANESAMWVLRKIYAILATSRAKGGFERRMTVTQFSHGTMKQDQTLSDNRGSGFLFFGKKKSGKGSAQGGGFDSYSGGE